MDASAFGAHHMQKKHQLAQGQTLKFEPVAADGSVSVTFRADRPFDINGEYDVTLPSPRPRLINSTGIRSLVQFLD